MKKVKKAGVIILCALFGAWLFLGVFMPIVYVILSGSDFRNGELVSVTALGFRNGQLTAIAYDKWSPTRKCIVETISVGKNISVSAYQQEDGAYKIDGVYIGNRSYDKNLENYPKFMKQANRILEIGRQRFAKVQKKYAVPIKKNASPADNPTPTVKQETTAPSVNNTNKEVPDMKKILDSLSGKSVKIVVKISGAEYTIFYRKRGRTGLNWNNALYYRAFYELQDEATLDTTFWITVRNENGKYSVDKIFPLDISEINKTSILQKIFLENTREKGEKIFIQIVKQIEASRKNKAAN